MTVVSYLSDEAEEPFSETSWQDVCQVTIDVVDTGAGDYILQASCEYAGTNVGQVVAVRITLDGVEVARDHFSPVISDEFKSFSPMGLKNLAEASCILKLQAVCLDATQIVKVRRKRLLVIKH